jgi:hypothetical protein
MATDYSDYTTEQLLAAYVQNGAYTRDNSTTMAREFITVCRALTVRLTGTSAKGTGSVSWAPNLTVIQQEMRDAQRWLEARDSTARVGPDVTYGDMDEFRGGARRSYEPWL